MQKKNEEKAIFLLDFLKNYARKVPGWSEPFVRLCTVWRFCSPKGYEFGRKHLSKLPSNITIPRYLGPFNGTSGLIKERLQAEIANLKNPIERVCSLIIDDISIREKMFYSRSEDCIYGLSSSSASTVSQNQT
ncbi:hypothetical protein Zmor_006651 [Zophobas morio]|uniref:Transposable element P transposase-like RNase H domain-containing protein n=1 Tax=Zophobas morio TaxID=2755281 RepID=A0AA38IV65_9CUCU|nr:hypothetical protein Zmor_006651 [Zophobas morio]